MDPIQLAAILAATILLASMVSIELGVAAALVELTFGLIVGNLFDLHSQPWLDFVAAFGSVLLAFLAGVEIDPAFFKRRLGPSLQIGVVSFLGPFIIGAVAAAAVLDWSLKASLIAGTTLSGTSIAIVYAVLVERGLSAAPIGKLLMSATFVTGVGTTVALTLIFIKLSWWFALFLVVSVLAVVLLPRIAPWFFRRYGDRITEPEIKLVFAALFCLMLVASEAGGAAVLPAFVLGLAMANHFASHRQEQQRLRVVAFAFFTPFFFVKVGIGVSLSAVVASVGALVLLAAAKVVPRLLGVRPLARRHAPRAVGFITLMMCTGLTFDAIAALYGLDLGVIDGDQFSLLMAVVVLSAVIPTAIAERWFMPPEARPADGAGGVPADEFV